MKKMFLDFPLTKQMLQFLTYKINYWLNFYYFTNKIKKKNKNKKNIKISTNIIYFNSVQLTDFVCL